MLMMELGGFSITVDDKKILDGWRGIGKSEDLGTDADIAKYLVALYSNLHQKDRQYSGQTGRRCVYCHAPLTLYCTSCQLPSEALPPVHSSLREPPPQQGSPSQVAVHQQGSSSPQAPPQQGSPAQQDPPKQGSSSPQDLPQQGASSSQAPPQRGSSSSQALRQQGSFSPQDLPQQSSSSPQALPQQGSPSQEGQPQQGSPLEKAAPQQGLSSRPAPPQQGLSSQQTSSQQTLPQQGSPSQQPLFPQGSLLQQATHLAVKDDAYSEEGDVGVVDVDSDSTETPEPVLDFRESVTNQTHSGLDGKAQAKSLAVVSRKADTLWMANTQTRPSCERKRAAKRTFCNASRELYKIGLGLKRKRKSSSSVEKTCLGKPSEKSAVHQESNSAQLEMFDITHTKQQNERSVKDQENKSISTGRQVYRATGGQPKAKSHAKTASKTTLANIIAKEAPSDSENGSPKKCTNDSVGRNAKQANSAHQAKKMVLTNKDCRASGSLTRKEHLSMSRGRPRSKLVSGKYLGALKKSNGQALFFSRFECAHCHEVFDRKSDFNRHVSTHYHGKPHICIKCGEGFKTFSDLKKHKRSTHSRLNKPPKFMCDECPAEFKTEGRFHRHKKLHRENKLFACKTCGFVASSKKGLDNHRLTHRKTAWVQCEYCGETKRVNNMQRHILMHKGEKPYKCTQCDAAFRTPFDLKDHVKRRHSEVKPFSCEKCGKGFICSDNLKHHLLVHSGQKPYKCSLCPSSFSRRDYLTKHIRTHTGEKPYKCSDCEEAFAYPNSLKLHKKQCHHGSDANPCESKTEREESHPAVKGEGGCPAENYRYLRGVESQGFGFLPSGVWLPPFSTPELG